jgi:hypothetical protein
VHGYEEVHLLSELDWQLLVPTFWAWLFIGIKGWLYKKAPADLAGLDFSWHVKQLARRSPLFGDLQQPYAGPGF